MITKLPKGEQYRFRILEGVVYPSYTDIPTIVENSPVCNHILYPEDIKIGSTYFGSPVKAIADYNPPQTYLTIFKFMLEDGTTRELFADQELP